VAALGSFLFARAAGGRWLVRIEDLDAPRVVPGSADEILRTLERFGLHWDGAVMRQSTRGLAYQEALERLRAGGFTFDCACSRKELAHASSAPARDDPADGGGLVYPGTCRRGLPEGRSARAVRLRVEPGVVKFTDLVHGVIGEDTFTVVGDFVLRRADGPFAYQLAVVVDDAEQGVTQVVRGADLLSSTARQLLLQRALELDSPSYAHTPLVVAANGVKLSKRDGALALETLTESRIAETLRLALGTLGQEAPVASGPELLEEAVKRFDPRTIPRASRQRS
jgi:glutamyl-Q tRNA(Asp) synthetase